MKYQSEPARAERFGQRIAEAARAVGYDIDSPYGGGRTVLAKTTGLSLSTVSRMLSGKTLPSPYSVSALADALGVPLGELLVLHGVVSRDPFTPEERAVRPLPTTPMEAAAALGITDPLSVRFFEVMVDALRLAEAEVER